MFGGRDEVRSRFLIGGALLIGSQTYQEGTEQSGQNTVNWVKALGNNA